MNILVLSNSPIVESQGSGYVIVNTAESLRNLGHTVDTVGPDQLEAFPALKSRGRNYRMALGMGKWTFANRKKLLRYSLIIVYGGESALAVFVIKKMLRLKAPVVLHSNGLEVHVNRRMEKQLETTNALRWYHFDQSWIFRYCYRHVDSVITVSEYERDFAVNELKLSPLKVYVLEPCLPAVFFDNERLTEAPKKPVIVYCGTWVARKGVDAIRAAIPVILQKFPEYSFRIIGTGKNFDPKEHFAEDLQKQIEWFPFVESKERMIELYAEASIFLCPSHYESFGLVVAEALFCGCAAVCGTTGFAAGLKHGEEALLLQEPDAPQIYGAVKRLIENEALRQRLAGNGKQRTAALRWTDYTLKMNEVLKGIFSNSGQRKLQAKMKWKETIASGSKA